MIMTRKRGYLAGGSYNVVEVLFGDSRCARCLQDALPDAQIGASVGRRHGDGRSCCSRDR